jgi:hypothetical protein
MAARIYSLFIVVGGIFALIFGLRQFVIVFREGGIPRRGGKKPLSPREAPLLFWGLIVWSSFGAVVIVWGIFVIVAHLFGYYSRPA